MKQQNSRTHRHKPNACETFFLNAGKGSEFPMNGIGAACCPYSYFFISGVIAKLCAGSEYINGFCVLHRYFLLYYGKRFVFFGPQNS